MSSLFRVRTAISGGPGGSELNTMFFNAASGTEQDAADAVRAFWFAQHNNIADGYTLVVEPQVVTIDSTNGKATSSASTTTTSVTGLDTNDPLPPATNGVIRMHTGLYIDGRELMGKIWIPGPTEDLNTNGVPNSTYLTASNSAFSGLLAATGAELCVWSRKHFQFFAVTGGSTWNLWGSLRSRRQ